MGLVVTERATGLQTRSSKHHSETVYMFEATGRETCEVSLPSFAMETIASPGETLLESDFDTGGSLSLTQVCTRFTCARAKGTQTLLN